MITQNKKTSHIVLQFACLATQLDTAEENISDRPPVILSALSPRSPKHSE